MATIVVGEGPDDATCMFVGEYVGREEMRTGHNFAGVTGQEFDNYMRLAGLNRRDCYVTNLVKSWSGNEAPPKDEYSRWIPYLLTEINYVKPRVLVLMGANVVELLLHERISDCVNKHIRTTIAGVELSVVPIFNPAYGLRKPREMQSIADGFRMVRRVLDGAAPILGTPLSVVIEGVDALNDAQDIIAIDTETATDGSVYSVSVALGASRCVFALANTAGLREALQRAVDRCTHVVFHNAIFDLQRLRELGVHVEASKVHDTMLLAYLIGDRPVGLKHLAAKYYGFRMQEFADLVRDASNDAAVEYLQKVATSTWPDCEPEVKIVDGCVKIVRHRNIAVRAAALLKGNTADLVQRWNRIKLNEGRRIVEEKLGKIPSVGVEHVDIGKLRSYACADAAVTYLLFTLFRLFEGQRYSAAVYDMNRAIIPMLVDMEWRGIKVDKDFVYGKLERSLKDLLAKSEAELHAMTGKLVNPRSAQQVAELLTSLGIIDEEVDGGSGHISTSKKELAKYADNEVVAKILELRHISKLINTYIYACHEYVKADGVVHTRFSMTATETGRLASYEPNLMNLPQRTDIGRQIRDAYVARDGFTLVACDYSQIEMRVVAHLSGDPLLLDMFTRNVDFHTQTAARMFRIDVDKVDPVKHRYPAKRVSFGVLYGITGSGLHTVFLLEGIRDFSEADCNAFIERWFDTYKGVRNWISMVRADVTERGFVEDMFGFRRYIYEVLSSNKAVRERGLREAVNMPVQAGAQGIMKRAMAAITKLDGYGDTFFPLMQIHDELLFEVRDDKLDEVVPRLLATMEGAVELKSKLVAEAKTGKRWGSLKAWGASQ